MKPTEYSVSSFVDISLRSLNGCVIKPFSGRCMNCMVASVALPALDGGVDIEWIELYSVAASSRTLRRNQSGPRTQEPIQDDITTR